MAQRTVYPNTCTAQRSMLIAMCLMPESALASEKRLAVDYRKRDRVVSDVASEAAILVSVQAGQYFKVASVGGAAVQRASQHPPTRGHVTAAGNHKVPLLLTCTPPDGNYHSTSKNQTQWILRRTIETRKKKLQPVFNNIGHKFCNKL